MVQVSIILPTYNERESLPILIENIFHVLKVYQKKFEVIVVDDHSPDKTYVVAREIARKKSWVRVIRRIHDKGLSSAILAGFSASKGDYLIAMDSDMQHDVAILPQMIQAFEEKFDIVIGSRKVNGGGIENWTFIRKTISWVASSMAKLILPFDVQDPMSGYFGFTRHIFEKLSSSINPKGFKLLLEFIAISNGLRIKEIGYIFRDRQFGKSKLSTGIIINYLIALYELTIGKFISLQLLKYAFVGLFGVAVNQLGLWFGIEHLNLPHVYALMVGIEFSIFTNFIFNNYWTFKDKQLSGFSHLLVGLIKFNIICLTGFVLNYSVALFLEGKFEVSIYYGNLVGIMISTMWNYIVNVKLTWEKMIP